MARLPPLLKLPLLLPLLPMYLVPTRAGSRELVVLAPLEVHGFLGDTVNLPCVLQPMEPEIPKVKQIRWERLERWGDPSTVAEFHWERGPSIKEPDRVRFVAAGKDKDLLDASLTLTELEPNDDANYTCEVTTFLQGTRRASTWLRVFYAPQVSISLYDHIGQQGHRETSLSCDARGNPKPSSYEWSTTTGTLPPYAVPQGPWLLLQLSEESIITTFICRVSNALGTTQIAMRVLLPGPGGSTGVPEMEPTSPSCQDLPGEQSLSYLNLMILIVGLLIVAVVLGTLIYIWCFRRSCRTQEVKEKVTPACISPGSILCSASLQPLSLSLAENERAPCDSVSHLDSGGSSEDMGHP